MPPLWQYFSPLLRSEPDELILAPLGQRARHLGYSCKSGTFRGTAMGAMTPMMAPPTTHPRSRAYAATRGPLAQFELERIRRDPAENTPLAEARDAEHQTGCRTPLGSIYNRETARRWPFVRPYRVTPRGLSTAS